ncbi:hypothetical protein LSH36_12g26025 [Paralvinella palmiformis]|uniref:Cadherin domain-containing protein n=1 Tax=Paralvinella palmiformis TaxID=53620 RepID=A0AAD9KDG6_9ANNE|nr:hypothetical protein LSH36_12g26025 [Paralvinella palmiformis]
MSFALILLLGLIRLGTSAEEQNTLYFRISEEQPSRSHVGDVLQAAKLADQYSPDVLPRLRFRFRGPDPLFEITETTGEIRTRRVIDREQIADCMYSASCVINQEVMITPYAYFKIIPIQIQIDDINDHAPEFPQPRITLDISESVSRNTTFSIPNAEDPDSGVYGVSRYELITPTDMFGIRVTALPDGSKDLSIIVLKQLDRERENFYSVEIRATDGAKPPKSGTLTVDISVVDFNDNNPVFDKELYEAQIYENLEINTPVVQVHAKDKDEGINGMIVYAFEAHTQANFGSFFGLHNGSGLIYVKGNIDYETHKSFHLTVVAHDLGQNSLPDYAKVNIDIMDLNDNAPEISVNTFTESRYARVPENVAPGHTVAYVGVSDPDSGRGGNVTCVIDNNNFRIQLRLNSGTTGYEIVSAREFDREDEEDYLVVIRCQDHGSPPQTSSVRISIRVTDVNDNAPYFRPNSTLFAVSVNENNNIGDTIIKMNTTDRDVMQNSAIRYYLKPLGDTPENAVAIDLITGVVTAKIEFDFETRKFYQYTVIAGDQGEPARSATTTLDLNIVDQNDGFPHFLKTSYSFSVLENQVANTDVGTITAVDSDSPPFDEIIYSLQSMGDSYKFYIDPDSGLITTSTILDREESAIYHLVAIASNKGSARVKTTVNVTVYVRDENDNPPVMIFPNESNNTIQVPTTMSVGHYVIQIEAADPDDRINGELSFAISSGNEDGIFGIDPETGAISAARAIKKRHLAKQILILKVTDHGEPERRTFARLTLVFNQSVPLSGAAAGALLGQDTLVILIVAAIGGCVFIVTVIALAICCVRRSRRDKNKKEHVYNCRAEEAKKALSSPDSRGSSTSDGFPESDRSVDTCIGGKTKDKAKKEVTFSVDMDDGWPLNSDKAVIEVSDFD